MCGIAGILSKDPSMVQRTTLISMTDVIAHRGPDGDGHWIAASGEVGFGHRRLSIIDLSHDADQPMHFADRYTIVFNGEIYNYIELRDELIQQGYHFRTQSDTEVLMALYDRDKTDCLSKLDGMFAFALYDKQTNEVFCVRDRFGEKPFFYSFQKGKHFVFGSEMKCLWAAGIPKVVNERMLFNYLSFGYLENPADLSETFYDGCTRLPHSNYLICNLHTLDIKIVKYYDIDWKQQNEGISVSEASTRFHELFYTSVSRRLRSDVSVGSSLSGGLDSSLVVCVIDELKKNSHQKQHTFSAVFPGYKKDERKFMDLVIAQTNVEPHFVTPDDMGLIRDLESLNYHQEEPYGSASIYAQYCVMRLAKEHDTTVLLDGQGADEVLAGYHHYYLPFFKGLKGSSSYAQQLQSYNDLHRNNPMNGITRRSKGDIVRSISPSLIKPVKRIRNAVQQFRSPYFHPDFYHAYNRQIFDTPGNVFHSLNEALYTSCMKYGIQQLLRYADRNSMAHSREVRLPFLSHDMVEFLFSLPDTMKMNEGWTKWIMRNTFSILPDAIRWRVDKIGYEPPQKAWMENPVVKERMTDSRDKLIQQHYLHASQANKSVTAVDAFEAGTTAWQQFMAGSMLSTK